MGIISFLFGKKKQPAEIKELNEKGEERKKYFWELAISSPRKYPVEVFKADFILDKEPNKEGNVRVRSYFGSDAMGGGMGIEKCTATDEGYREVLPRYIEAQWQIYEDKKVYYLYAELPYEEIERFFVEGYDFYENRNAQAQRENYDVINVCFLPEGKVVLYLNGTTRTILLDWSAQGKATDEFNDEICEEHSITPPLEEYVDRLLKINPHIDVERDLPMGDILEKYFEKFAYEIRLELDKERISPAWAKEEYANGEKICSRRRSKVESIKTPARLRYYEVTWYYGEYKYEGEFWFHEEQMLRVYDEAYGDDRMQEGVLLISYSEKDNVWEIALQVGDKKYALNQTEASIYKIPEALESDKDAFWELVYKNFEGDHSNAFRVK